PEPELHEGRSLDRVEAVRLGLLEAERTVERTCALHRRERVEPHALEAELARAGDRCLSEGAPETRAARRRAHVEPLHLARAVPERPQRDAADDLDAYPAEQ